MAYLIQQFLDCKRKCQEHWKRVKTVLLFLSLHQQFHETELNSSLLTKSQPDFQISFCLSSHLPPHRWNFPLTLTSITEADSLELRSKASGHRAAGVRPNFHWKSLWQKGGALGFHILYSKSASCFSVDRRSWRRTDNRTRRSASGPKSPTFVWLCRAPGWTPGRGAPRSSEGRTAKGRLWGTQLFANA